MRHLSVFFLVLGLSSSAFAQAKKGGFYVGLDLGYTTSEQSDMNILRQRANIRDGGISAGDLKNGYEFAAEFGTRLGTSIFAILLKPSYFSQKSVGSGASGNYEYSLNGITIFPIFRIYALESSVMRFYMQFGLGYGSSNGTIQEGSASVSFSGSSYGTLYGLGTEFQLGARHGLGLEGCYRFLKFERNIAGSASGSWAPDSLSQGVAGREVEYDSQDLGTNFTGLQFFLRYIFYL